MHHEWSLGLTGLLFAALGAWQLLTPLDALWARQERVLLARGLVPQRSEIWENSARTRGGVLLIGGLLLLLLALGLGSVKPEPMSGVSIDGHALTQKEWDDCGHKMESCVGWYLNTHPPH